MSAYITIICAGLLLEVKKQTGLSSFTDMGYKLYGGPGKIIVDISISLS